MKYLLLFLLLSSCATPTIPNGIYESDLRDDMTKPGEFKVPECMIDL